MRFKARFMQVLLPDIIFLNHYKGIADNTHSSGFRCSWGFLCNTERRNQENHKISVEIKVAINVLQMICRLLSRVKCWQKRWYENINSEIFYIRDFRPGSIGREGVPFFVTFLHGSVPKSSLGRNMVVFRSLWVVLVDNFCSTMYHW